MTIYKLNKIMSSEIKSRLIAHFWNCKCCGHDVTSLVKKLGGTQSNISKHLISLSKKGVLDVDRKGKERYYKINSKFKNEWYEVIEPQIKREPNFNYRCKCNS